MGELSLSNLVICIKKAEFSGFKAYKMISKVRYYPKLNLGQNNAFKLMFAIELSMEKRMINFLAAGFSVFTSDKCICLNSTCMMFLDRTWNVHCIGR